MYSKHNFSDFFINNLNQEQQQAVLHKNGSLLVVAGAGSGKTRVITARITHLIVNESINASHIIALTFTNKAAHEMKERITQFLTKDQGIPFIGTFHSYCLYILKSNAHLLSYAPFSIIDEDDKRNIIQNLLKKSTLHKKYTPQQISSYISLIKNQATLDQPIIKSYDQYDIDDITRSYEKEKRISKCLDFDDLLIEATKLLSENSTVRNDHHNRIKHILIDEYQDTNTIQHKLLQLMALDNKIQIIDSVCVVGDEDQSIYSWRGATIDNIRQFQNDFKDTLIIKIEQNYRSKQPILTIANTIIKNNKHRIEKKLWSNNEGKDCIRSIRCMSGYQEADIIANYINLIKQHDKKSSIAILYRTHIQSRTLEESLFKHSIPYTIIGGIKFYERKEIKDIIAYLKVIANPFDKIAIQRMINCPQRGLGDAFQESFFNYWSEQPFFNFYEIVNSFTENTTHTKLKNLQELSLFMQSYNTKSNALETVNSILNKIEYNNYIIEHYEKHEAQDRTENIQEFINACHFFAQQGKLTIQAVLDEVSLLQDTTHTDDNEAQERILLMTIHAAKGLEFDYVIIAGLEESIFPSYRSLSTDSQLEEERRLLYVAITRTRNRLLLSHARYRQTYGTMEQMAPSRFLDEISHEHCQSDDASSWHTHEVTHYFSQWLTLKTSLSQVMTFNKKTNIQSHNTLSIKNQQTNDFSTSSEKNTTNYQYNNLQPNASFKKHQAVRHETFGLGIIHTIETKNGKIFITAAFKTGIKKVDSTFLTIAK